MFAGSLRRIAAVVCFCVLYALFAAPVHAGDTVKVYLLAGQSNMEGKAQNPLWDHQATDAKTKDFFAHLRDGDKWVERDDVFIKFLGRHGKLTLGYGSNGRTGSEYEFGYVMGEHHKEPVILIKAAWGGHSLYQKFRSPSAGMPPADRLQAELENAQKRVKSDNEKHKRNNPLPTMDDIKKPYGMSYRNMMTEVKDVQANYATMFPGLKGKKIEFAGFFWFQGFNDQFGDYAPNEYAANMKHLINDARKDLGAPKLPVVIASIGTFADKPERAETHAVYQAQMSMNGIAEYKGNVTAIATHPLVDKAAMELFPTWKQNFEKWKLTGSDRPYHYYGSAIWYTRIGKACADAMIELQK